MKPPPSPLSFVPLRGFASPHAQTLAGKAFRRPGPLSMHPLRLETPDGDFLDLLLSPSTHDPARPLVLVLHGLEGPAHRSYMRTIYEALELRGMAPVGMNFRGCSGEPNRRPRAYHSGETGDGLFALNELARRFPNRRMGLVGVSLGGNVALKLLGEGGAANSAQSPSPPLTAAAVISVPFDLGSGVRHLEQGGFYRLYQAYFLRSLRKKIRAKEHLLRDVLDLKKALAATTLRDFDEHVTAPLHGFATADQYYDQSSASGYVETINCPTLVVHAIDDPFLPKKDIPVAAMAANPAIATLLTQRGGHVGFIGRESGHRRFWAESRVADFLSKHLVFEG